MALKANVSSSVAVERTVPLYFINIEAAINRFTLAVLSFRDKVYIWMRLPLLITPVPRAVQSDPDRHLIHGRIRHTRVL